MSNDAAAFVAEIDQRIAAYQSEIRERAESAKAGLASGVLGLRAKADPEGAAFGAGGGWDAEGDSLDMAAASGSSEELSEFEGLGEPTNGAHPLDAPIFADGDSFLSDDLDFSIDLDDKDLPS